jgi:hypothetical protein
MQDQALLECGAQRPVQSVFQVQLTVPVDNVREQVAVEGRVGGEDGVQVQHVLRRDQLVQPNRPWRYLRPFPRGPGMFGVRPSVPDLLEDHIVSLKESGSPRRDLRPGDQ